VFGFTVSDLLFQIYCFGFTVSDLLFRIYLYIERGFTITKMPFKLRKVKSLLTFGRCNFYHVIYLS